MNYIPSKCDIVWVEFNPQKGHEQKRHRPAIVISPYKYNAKTDLAIVCPITSKIKGYPFEVKINGKITLGNIWQKTLFSIYLLIYTIFHQRI